MEPELRRKDDFMTLLLYRLDDKVTDSYEEYLAERDNCKIAYNFYIEGVKDYSEKSPTTYEEVVGKEKLPFFCR